MTNRMKLDFIGFLNNISYLLSSDDIDTINENAIGIDAGMQILCCYMELIAKHAIESDDDYLIKLLLDMHVIEEDEEKKDET